MLGKRGPYQGKFQQRRKRAKYVQTHGTGLETKTYGPGYQPGQRRSAGRPELLHYTTGKNLTALDTAPSGANPALYHVLTLNNIAQGDTGDGRKGNKICAKKITVRMKVEVDPNSDGVYTNLVSSGHLFRVLIYLDTRPNGAGVTINQLLDPNPANDGQIYSYNNIYAKDRFKILSDKWLQVPPSFILYDGTNYHSGGNTQVLGTLAGKGKLSDKHKGGKVVIKVDEPSYLIGIVSLTPRIDYSQGNNWDIHLQTMDDLHKPALDQIGFQELITEQMAWWNTHYDLGSGTWITRSAGKQPAWLNYMTNVNKTYGNFAIENNEMFMTLNRRYEMVLEDPEVSIDDLTTYIHPEKYN